jgi:hypothetical protein
MGSTLYSNEEMLSIGDIKLTKTLEIKIVSNWFHGNGVIPM